MLWCLRDSINISATLRNGTDYYEAVWTVAAHDMWRFYTSIPNENAYHTSAIQAAGISGINISMQDEEHRAANVYANLASVNDHYFSDQAGLDLLYLPKSFSV